MRIAHLGATGRVGSKILAELVLRGHRVTALSRNPGRTPSIAGVTAAHADILEPADLSKALAGHEAIISSAVFVPGSSPQLLEAFRRSAVKRCVVVGGAGSLITPSGAIVADATEMPEAWRPFIREGIELLRLLRQDRELDWTYISPPILLGPGSRQGEYRVGSDSPVTASDGTSKISYEDYAIAVVDEVERGKHIRQRFTVGY